MTHDFGIKRYLYSKKLTGNKISICINSLAQFIVSNEEEIIMQDKNGFYEIESIKIRGCDEALKYGLYEFAYKLSEKNG